MENVLGANKGVVQTLIVAVLTVALATVVGGVSLPIGSASVKLIMNLSGDFNILIYIMLESHRVASRCLDIAIMSTIIFVTLVDEWLSQIIIKLTVMLL